MYLYIVYIGWIFLRVICIQFKELSLVLTPCHSDNLVFTYPIIHQKWANRKNEQFYIYLKFCEKLHRPRDSKILGITERDHQRLLESIDIVRFSLMRTPCGGDGDDRSGADWRSLGITERAKGAPPSKLSSVYLAVYNAASYPRSQETQATANLDVVCLWKVH